MERTAKLIVQLAAAIVFSAILSPVKAIAILPGDTNLDGVVSIAEVQMAINAFLGLIPNTAPIAYAGSDLNVTTGSVVTLDGSKSSDPDGYPITYNWYISSKPTGSNAVLSDYSYVKPVFTPDRAGTYIISLVVNDGQLNSPVANVTVTALLLPAGYTAALTDSATSIMNNSAILNGSFTNPAGFTTAVWFEYGATTSYGSSTSKFDYAAVGLILIQAPISGLSQQTTFHFRIVTQNSSGIFYGGDNFFSTISTPEVLASDLDAPTGLALNGSYVYWFEIYSGKLRRAEINSGIVNTLATVATLGNSGCIATDSKYVYFTASGSIMRADLDGSNLNVDFSQTSNTTLIVPHSTGLYVRHSQDILFEGVWTTHYYISRISLDGLQRTILYERTPISSESFGGDIVIDETTIYWSDYFKGTIQKMAISGGSPVTVALGLNHPLDLLLDGTTLYVATDNGIKKLPASGGIVTDVFTSGTGTMAKDGNHLYIAANELGKIDLLTGISTRLIANSEIYYPPVLSSNFIYWVTNGSRYTGYGYGKLERLPRL